jgi:hypothetical protein
VLTVIPPEKKTSLATEAFYWLQNNDIVPQLLDDPTVHALSNLADIGSPTNLASPKEKKKIFDDAIAWLHQNDPSPESLDDPTIQALARIDELLPHGSFPNTKKELIINDSVSWL